jgi:hypothetical protein
MHHGAASLKSRNNRRERNEGAAAADPPGMHGYPDALLEAVCGASETLQGNHHFSRSATSALKASPCEMSHVANANLAFVNSFLFGLVAVPSRRDRFPIHEACQRRRGGIVIRFKSRAAP